MLRIVLFTALLAPVASSQINYTLTTNPAGSAAALIVSDVTAVTQQLVTVPTQVDNYSATAPTPVNQVDQATLAGSKLTWSRGCNNHGQQGHDPSHWSIGESVSCLVNNASGHLLDFTWNVSSRVQVVDPVASSGALRLEVRETGQPWPQDWTAAGMVMPRVQVTFNGQTYSAEAVWSRNVGHNTTNVADPQFVEIRLDTSPLPQQLDVVFSGSVQTDRPIVGHSISYECRLSYWPNAAPLNPVTARNDVMLLGTFERVPSPGRTDEIVFRADFDELNHHFPVAPNPSQFAAIYAIGQQLQWPFPALLESAVEVDVFGYGYNGLADAVYRSGAQTDYIEKLMALPIDHGTWYMQWILSDSDLNHTVTSRTFRIN